MHRIDAHAHYGGDHPDFINLLERLDLKLLNVCVASDATGQWRDYAKICQQLVEQHPVQYAWCTTFTPPNFHKTNPEKTDPVYAERVIENLVLDFKAGAVACKIWKNIGMRIRKPGDDFLMVDDPLFDPIFEFLAASGKPLLMHDGEPLGCWQPLNENNPYRAYYNNHPEWYMGDKPDYPSHKALMDARDRVLTKHPRLKVVGAHLGSMEYDVTELSKRLDSYPNFALDTSGQTRMIDLGRQDHQVVRRFFIDYQDRLLFGTDVSSQRRLLSSLHEDMRQKYLQSFEERYDTAFVFFETTQQVNIRGHAVQGLGLPSRVLEKLYFTNACEWYPNINTHP